MLQFWAHGYEGTSVAALTEAMGLRPPSLYAAFGNKERLFLEAVQLYTGDLSDLSDRLERSRTAKKAADTFLRDSATTFTGATTPPGCLLASAVASGSPAALDVQRAVADIRAQTTAALRLRIERDIAQGQLAADTDATALAAFVVCLTQGMSVLARDGAPREALLALIDQAMTGWPAHASHSSPEPRSGSTSLTSRGESGSASHSASEPS